MDTVTQSWTIDSDGAEYGDVGVHAVVYRHVTSFGTYDEAVVLAPGIGELTRRYFDRNRYIDGAFGWNREADCYDERARWHGHIAAAYLSVHHAAYDYENQNLTLSERVELVERTQRILARIGARLSAAIPDDDDRRWLIADVLRSELPGIDAY